MGAVTILVNKPATSNTMKFTTDDGFTGSMHTTPTGFTYKDIPNFGQVEREGLINHYPSKAALCAALAGKFQGPQFPV